MDVPLACSSACGMSALSQQGANVQGAKACGEMAVGATFQHQARHRSRRGPAESRLRRVLPEAGCRNLGTCGTCDSKCGYGCVCGTPDSNTPF
eukprot:285154-Chlamydomonas_euryale.AAC.5